MLLSKFKKCIAFAEKVFVWVELHPQDGVWLQIPKTVLLDYISQSLETTEFVATLVNEELFVGHEYQEF